MGRVSDYNIGRRHLLHHTLPCLSLLAFPDLTLDLGIAFSLFVLLFEFLPGHTQILFVVPPLIEQVKSCHKSHGNRHRLDYGQDHVAGIGHGLEWFHIHQPGEVPEILLERVPDDGAQDDDLDHRLEQFNDTPQGEHPLEALQRAQAAEFGRQGFHGKEAPGLCHSGDDRHQ